MELQPLIAGTAISRSGFGKVLGRNREDVSAGN